MKKILFWFVIVLATFCLVSCNHDMSNENERLWTFKENEVSCSVEEYNERNGSSSVVIPSTYNGKPVTSIGSFAFSGCSGLTEIVIPSSVTSIGRFAFSDCSGLSEIVIPSSVTSIGPFAFSGCNDLSIVFAEGMKSIPEEALSEASGIVSVSIPSSVTSIGRSAFFDCSGLSEIVIPSSVTSIGPFAFFGCSVLTSIVYSGTKAQWNSIAIDLGWDSNTGNYTIHCTDGDIAKN